MGRNAQLYSWFPYFGDEACLHGWNGSGAVYFARCNLRCVFCENYDVSQEGYCADTPPEQLADIMLALQERGCHNIHLITPSHVVPQILEALMLAIPAGLHLPLVYDTSAYDSIESLRLLDGVVDIYVPDFKYWSTGLSSRYLTVSDYPNHARAAIKAMHRQVGDLVVSNQGIAQRGLLVRHLVMPDAEMETRRILQFIAKEVSVNTYVNLMDDYLPSGKILDPRYPRAAGISRPTATVEYEQARACATALGLTRLE